MTAIFPVLNEDGPDYVRGLWHGYACALDDAYGEAQAALRTLIGTWQGKRATLFWTWWERASKDFENLIDVAQRMAQAYKIFADACPNINKLSAQMSSLVTDNTHPGHPDTYVFNETGAHKNDLLFVQITGWVFGPIKGPGIEHAEPEWYSELCTCLRQVYQEYNDAAHQATAAIGDAPSLLRSMSQLKEISRDSTAWNSNSPMASLNDPTWNQLTGGGVFRPPLPPGFNGYQFSTKGMPGWYNQSPLSQIGSWIGGHIDDILDVGELVLTLAGMPELAGVIAFVDNGVTVAGAALKGDWADVVTGAIELAIPLAGGSTVGQVLSKFDLSDDFGNALAKVFMTSDDTMSITLAKAIGGKVQDEVEAYLKQRLGLMKNDGTPFPKHITVPATVLQQIIASAAEQMGYKQATAAAAR
jgi:uncharacterized protein YukE